MSYRFLSVLNLRNYLNKAEHILDKQWPVAWPVGVGTFAPTNQKYFQNHLNIISR